MFIDELKSKLDFKSELLPFTLNMLSRKKLVISGVKRILYSSDTRLKLSLIGDVVTIDGEGLNLLQIGGGDVYVAGLIGGIGFEKK